MTLACSGRWCHLDLTSWRMKPKLQGLRHKKGPSEALYMKKCCWFHAEKYANPRVLKNKNLPLDWMHDPKAWITKILTSNSFHQCFLPQAKNYLHNIGMDFKKLLTMNNSGGHPLDLFFTRESRLNSSLSTPRPSSNLWTKAWFVPF